MRRKFEEILVNLSDDIMKRNVNSACIFMLYQPKVTDKLKKKYKK